MAFGALTKGEACDNLVEAIAKNRKYKGNKSDRALAMVRDKCMAHWHKPRAKHVNPANRGCPVRTVTIRRKSGKVVTSFKAHVCGKKGRRRK